MGDTWAFFQSSEITPLVSDWLKTKLRSGASSWASSLRALAGMLSGHEALRTWKGAWWSRWLRHVMHWFWGSGYLRVLGLYYHCQVGRQTGTGHSEWMPSRRCHLRAGRYVSGVALLCYPGVGIWHTCNARRWRNPYVWGFLRRWNSCSSNGHYAGRSWCRAWGHWISPIVLLCACACLGCMSAAFSCTFCGLLVWSWGDAACGMSSSTECGGPWMFGDVVWGETSLCWRHCL